MQRKQVIPFEGREKTLSWIKWSACTRHFTHVVSFKFPQHLDKTGISVTILQIKKLSLKGGGHTVKGLIQAIPWNGNSNVSLFEPKIHTHIFYNIASYAWKLQRGAELLQKKGNEKPRTTGFKLNQGRNGNYKVTGQLSDHVLRQSDLTAHPEHSLNCWV